MSAITDLNSQLAKTRDLIISKRQTKASYTASYEAWLNSAKEWFALADTPFTLRKTKDARIAKGNEAMMRAKEYRALEIQTGIDITNLAKQETQILNSIDAYYDAINVATEQGIPEGGDVAIAESIAAENIAKTNLAITQQEAKNALEVKALEKGLTTEELKKRNQMGRCQKKEMMT